MQYYDFTTSPYGQMLLVADGEGISGIYFEGQKFCSRIAPEWRRDEQHAPLRQAKQELAEYFGGEREQFGTALAPKGTPFQHAVWKAIDEVDGTLEPGAELDDIPVMQLLLNRGLMTGCLIEGRFLDVGLPSGYAEANEYLARGGDARLLR